MQDVDERCKIIGPENALDLLREDRTVRQIGIGDRLLEKRVIVGQQYPRGRRAAGFVIFAFDRGAVEFGIFNRNRVVSLLVPARR